MANSQRGAFVAAGLSPRNVSATRPAQAGTAVLASLVAAAIVFASPQPGRAAAESLRAEIQLPIERQLHEQFPSVVLDSHAALEPAQERVAGTMVSGLRAAASSQPFAHALPGDAGAASGDLRVFYPSSYDEPFVVELGDQRVVLRAVGAHFAQAEAAAGKLFYTSPHDSVDVVEVPSASRSEELMLLHDTRAPRVFEYEIVEMRGVAGLILQNGAIRFVPDHVAVPTASKMASGRFVVPPPSLQIDRPWIIDANGRRSENAAQWTIVKRNDGPQTIRLTINADPLSYPLVVDPSFTEVGLLTTTRAGHTATLLPNGKVLLAGGYEGTGAGTGYLNEAELYDPATGTFTNISPMTAARSEQTATLLLNGKVLIAGGYTGSSYLNTAELYDPATATFTATSGTMNAARELHTATLLPNGKVLIAGGYGPAGDLNTAEVYDPGSETFTATSAPMTSARSQQTATLLPNGKVLIAGGHTGGLSFSNTAELYDPASGTFTVASATMASARAHHTATLLASGKVLIAGGTNLSSVWNTADLYDPVAGTFTATSSTMTSARYNHTATLLPNGQVLLTGGYNGSAYLNTAELYDPASGTFTATSTTMNRVRGSHTATMLPDGTVLLAGGFNGSTYATVGELYDPPSGTFAAISATMTSARSLHTATLLPNGTVLIAGGSAVGAVNTAELYDPANSTFTATSSTMTSARERHTATLLPSGKVLIAGGFNTSTALNTAELYDPANGTFTATSSTMTSARTGHTATLLPNGKVLIAGGSDATRYLNSAELYDPASGTFTPTIGNMTTAREGHTATLLANGEVLIAGGYISTELNTAELYDPDSETFTATSATMTTARVNHTATLLPNGKVLIVGGTNGSLLYTTELYDPTVGTFTQSGSMNFVRENHTATLLPGGKVLVAGGYGELQIGGGESVLNSAELYDPVNGTFTATSAPMNSARLSQTATLLSTGKVLIAGGYDGSSVPQNTAELYDPGLGFTDAWRPVISSLTDPLCQPTGLTLSGSLFTGDSEGSSGSTNNSAANAPLLRLQRIDNEQLQYALTQSYSAGSFLSATLNNLSAGRYRAAIVSNGIPSDEQIIDIETTPLLGTYANTSVNLSASTVVAPTSLPAGYNGFYYPQSTSVSGGFTGTLLVNGTTGGIEVTNPGPPGDFTVTVSSSTACGSATTTPFSLEVIGPPSSVVTAGTPQSAQVNASFGLPLRVTVRDSAGHLLNNVNVTFSDPLSGASATLPNGGATVTNSSGVASVTATANGILGSYTVRALVGGLTEQFALTNTPATPTNVVATAITTTSVSVTWNGTAGATYEVVRVGAGSTSTTIGTSTGGSLTDTNAAAATAYLYEVHAIAPAASPFGAPDLATTVLFTDPTLVPGTTPIKAAHFTELRTAVNAVRTLAGLGAGSYTDPTLTPGVTPVKAVHITDLRAALDTARSTLLLPAISYTRSNIVVGTTTISAVDINDLRAGVR